MKHGWTADSEVQAHGYIMVRDELQDVKAGGMVEVMLYD